jgi:hypothetical protein
LNTDKILDDQQAKQNLRDLGFTVEGYTMNKVIDVLTGKNPVSLYDIYTSKDRRDGTRRDYVCAKATAYKIKRFYKAGKLDPYIDYLNHRNTKLDISKQPTEDESEDPEKQRQQISHIEKMQELARKAVDNVPLLFPDFKGSDDPELLFYTFNSNIVTVVRRLIGDPDWKDLAVHLGEEGNEIEAIEKTLDDLPDVIFPKANTKPNLDSHLELSEIWMLLKYKGLKTISDYSDTREWERHNLNQRCPACPLQKYDPYYWSPIELAGI